MGWNDVRTNNSVILKNIKDPKFYFLHSYFMNLNTHSEIDAYADYGGRFPCAVSKNNKIFGVQFHPEKSHNSGIQVLKNFANLK